MHLLRDYLGLSQTELANELGLNQSTISRWENGKTFGRSYNIAALDSLLRRKGLPNVLSGLRFTPSDYERLGISSTNQQNGACNVNDRNNRSAEAQQDQTAAFSKPNESAEHQTNDTAKVQ